MFNFHFKLTKSSPLFPSNFIIKESTLDSLGGSLRVAVFEIAKGGGPGKFVGESSIRLEGLPPGVSRDIEQELRARGGTGGQVEGQLRVIATYFSDMAEEEGGPKDSDSVVTDDSTVETSTTVEEPSLQTELDRLRAKIAAQDEEIDALHAEIDSLKKSGGTSSSSSSSSSSSEKEIQQLKAKISSLESQLAAAKNETADAVAQATRDATKSAASNPRAQLMAAIRESAGIPEKKDISGDYSPNSSSSGAAGGAGGGGSEEEKKLKVLKQAYLKLRGEFSTLQENFDRVSSELEEVKSAKGGGGGGGGGGGLGSGGGSPAIGSIKSLSTSPPTRGSESGMDSSAVQALRKDRELLVQQLREKDSEIDDLNNKYAGERKKVLGKLMEAKEQITALTQERDDYREKWMKSH